MNWKPTTPPHKKYKKKVFENAAKVGDFVYQIGEYPQLRKPSQEIPLNKLRTKETQEKISYLKDCLIKYRKITGYGRGITAVQVGIPERFSVIYTPSEIFAIINPKITKKSKKLLIYPEMCMSANPIIAPTVRPSWIEFEYYDESGQLRQWDTKDDDDLWKMMNRVFQHEIDHMEGIINVDRIKNPKDLILESDPEFYTTANFKEV